MPFGGGDDGWPSLEDVKRRANLLDLSVHDEEASVVLAAAIGQIKSEVGKWDELTDLPTDGMAEAALNRAMELVGDVPTPFSERRSIALLRGQRRRFGIG
jgi:hypothetical protein